MIGRLPSDASFNRSPRHAERVRQRVTMTLRSRGPFQSFQPHQPSRNRVGQHQPSGAKPTLKMNKGASPSRPFFREQTQRPTPRSHNPEGRGNNTNRSRNNAPRIAPRSAGLEGPFQREVPALRRFHRRPRATKRRARVLRGSSSPRPRARCLGPLKERAPSSLLRREPGPRRGADGRVHRRGALAL